MPNIYTGTFSRASQFTSPVLDHVLQLVLATGLLPTGFKRNPDGTGLPADLYLYNVHLELADDVEGVPNPARLLFNVMHHRGLSAPNAYAGGAALGSLVGDAKGGVSLSFASTPGDGVQVSFAEGSGVSGPVIAALLRIILQKAGAIPLIPGAGNGASQVALSPSPNRVMQLMVAPGQAPEPVVPASPGPSDVVTVASSDGFLARIPTMVANMTEGGLGTPLKSDPSLTLNSFDASFHAGHILLSGSAEKEVTGPNATVDFEVEVGMTVAPGADGLPAPKLFIANTNVEVSGGLVTEIWAFVPLVFAQWLLDVKTAEAEDQVESLIGGKLAGFGLPGSRSTTVAGAGIIPEGFIVYSELPPAGPPVEKPRIPAIYVNKKTKIFHAVGCPYGDKIYKPGLLEHDSVGLAAALGAGHNGCWVCMRQYHRKSPGDVRFYFKGINSPHQQSDVDLLIHAEPLKLDHANELGKTSGQSFTMPVHVVSDQYGIARLKTKIPGLGAGTWRFEVSAPVVPGWVSKGDRYVSAYVPARPLYAVPGHDSLDPLLSDPLDLSVAPGAVRVSLWLQGFSQAQIDAMGVSVRLGLTDPRETWGKGDAGPLLVNAPLTAGFQTEWQGEVLHAWTELHDVLPGRWKATLKLSGPSSLEQIQDLEVGPGPALAQVSCSAHAA